MQLEYEARIEKKQRGSRETYRFFWGSLPERLLKVGPASFNNCQGSQDRRLCFKFLLASQESSQPKTHLHATKCPLPSFLPLFPCAVFSRFQHWLWLIQPSSYACHNYLYFALWAVINQSIYKFVLKKAYLIGRDGPISFEQRRPNCSLVCTWTIFYYISQNKCEQ